MLLEDAHSRHLDEDDPIAFVQRTRGSTQLPKGCWPLQTGCIYATSITTAYFFLIHEAASSQCFQLPTLLCQETGVAVQNVGL